MSVDKLLFKNRCHSVNKGETTNLKKPAIDPANQHSFRRKDAWQYLPACILAIDVDCWSQMEVTGRFSLRSNSPCLKNSSHTFKLHLCEMSHGRVGLEMSAHLSEICNMNWRFSALRKSSVSSSRCFLNFVRNSCCLLMSVASMRSRICTSNSLL